MKIKIDLWGNVPENLRSLLQQISEFYLNQIALFSKIQTDSNQKILNVMKLTNIFSEISNFCMLRYETSRIEFKFVSTICIQLQ